MNYLSFEIAFQFEDDLGRTHTSQFEFSSFKSALDFGWMDSEHISMDSRIVMSSIWMCGIEVEDLDLF
jgi:hypothetical protein